MDSIDILGARTTPFALAVIVAEAMIGTAIAVAVVMAHLHKGRNHHWIILSAFLVDLLVMKPLMMFRVSQGFFGDFPYVHTSGLPHISLAVGTACVGGLNVWLGFRYRVKSARSKNFSLGRKGRRHRLVGTAFLVLWSATFVYGLWIFYTSYVRPFS